MTWHNTLAEWSQWFWPLAINHLWQATLFTLLVWAAMLLLRQASARARHVAWMLAMVKFLLPAALLASAFDKLGLRFSRAEALATDFSTSALILFETAEPVAEASSLASHSEAYCLMTLAWSAGAIAVCGYWQTRRWRLAQALKAGSVPATERVLKLFAELQKRLGFARPVSLIVSASIAEPGVWGILRPKIVLPPELDERLNDEELSAVLMHELIHINQRDNLFSTVQMIVCSLLWFHPLVWLIDRKLLGECELMCDEKVLRFGGTAESYAAGLWKVVQHGLGWPVAGVSRVTGSNLKRRVELMLKMNYQRELSWRQRFLIGLIMSLLTILSFVLGPLSQTQTWAQKHWSNSTKSFPSEDRIVQLTVGGITDAVSVDTFDGNKTDISSDVARGVARIASDVTEGAGNIDFKAQNLTANNQQLPDWLLIEQAPEFPMQIDSPNGAPVLIKQATVKALVGQSRDAYEVLTDPKQVNSANILAQKFVLTLQNRQNKPIKHAQCEIENPSLLAKSEFPPTSFLRTQVINSAESFFIGKEVMSYIDLRLGMRPSVVDYIVRVIRVEYEDGTVWEAHPSSPSNSESLQKDTVNESARPKITYRERAQYTKEARDQKVEGTIVLSAEYGADGVIRDIKVERGLPYGLTESALEAAKAIRFEPAMKDGQPVSVRGKMEFYFSLGQ